MDTQPIVSILCKVIPTVSVEYIRFTVNDFMKYHSHSNFKCPYCLHKKYNLSRELIGKNYFKCSKCHNELCEQLVYVAAIEQYIRKQMRKENFVEPRYVDIKIIAGG